MIFGSPNRGIIRPPGWKRPSGNVDFRVTQDFGPTSFTGEPSLSWNGGEGIPTAYYSHFHKGLDLSNGKCGADVIAAQKGTVRFAGLLSDGNICVILDHGDGWQTAYGHLASEVVSKGQSVVKGQKIGAVGSTGHSTACHLHFMVKSGVSANQTISFFANSNGRLRDPWPRLAQNVTVSLRDDGINVRLDANMGAVYAMSRADGLLHRASDDATLGPFSMQRPWGGTVNGATYTIGGVSGKTWDKISVEGVWRYVATPLAMTSVQ